MPDLTLSEQLAEMNRECELNWVYNVEAITRLRIWAAKAARLLAPLEADPETAELLRRAAEYEGGCIEVVENAEALAADLRAHARALMELGEARAKLGRVQALLDKHAVVFDDELDAALGELAEAQEKEAPGV